MNDTLNNGATPYYRKRIKVELEERLEKNPRYSLRAFSKALGFEASSISQIIAGKRVPSFKTAIRITDSLALSPEEKNQFLWSLADIQRKRNLKLLKPFLNEKIEESLKPKELSIDLFRVISDWYHYAILALSLTKGFKSDPKWICSKLNISELETKMAIDRLLELGLLERKKGKLISVEKNISTADKQLTTAAHRKHQKQILEKALHSLDNDPIESRCMLSTTLPIDPKKIPLVKKKIEEFTKEICQLADAGTITDVYELGISFFPLIKKNRRSTK